MLSYKEFNETQKIDESKINDIYKNILNKSQELGKETKDYLKKTWKTSKREYKQTLMAIDILTQKMLKGREITEKEKEFVKAQAKDMIKLLPLIALQAVPGGTVAITPLLLAMGKKYNFSIIPSDQEEPDSFKDKEYNPVKIIKNKIIKNE